MAKKSKLAKYKAKRKAKAKSNPEKKQVMEFGANVGAGFAGYAATRFISRVAYSQALKRFPKASSHVHVAASALGAAGVYFGSKHWEKVDEYHEAAAIGAGIALLQTTMQTYLPKFGWLVSDVSEDQYTRKKKVKRTLPEANLDTLLPPEEPDALPEASDNLGAFDLDALLASDNSIEAVEIGQAPPVEDPSSNLSDDMLLVSDDYGSDPLAEYNGMLQ